MAFEVTSCPETTSLLNLGLLLLYIPSLVFLFRSQVSWIALIPHPQFIVHYPPQDISWFKFNVFWPSPVAQMVKNPSALQEMGVPSLGQADPLEEERSTLSSILAWRIPWTEEPGGLQPMGSIRVGHDLLTKPPLPLQLKQEQATWMDHTCNWPITNIQQIFMYSLSLHIPVSFGAPPATDKHSNMFI